MKRPDVIVILGLTATGKSDLAVKIAKKIGGEIISADSRQVYKGLDIGTGKISKKDMREVPHYLLDIVNPRQKFSVSQYQKMGIAKMREISERNKIPIICGGTGFYIEALTEGNIFPEVSPDRKLREKLSKKSLSKLYVILNELDPDRAKNIDKNNKFRLIRAIEIVKLLGYIPKKRKIKPKYRFIKIGLYLSSEKLKANIERRVRRMFREGLLKEIHKLKKRGLSGIRLRELGFEYFEPEYEKLVRETMKYAKRQMTWFKRDQKINWFDASDINLYRNVEKYILDIFK